MSGGSAGGAVSVAERWRVGAAGTGSDETGIADGARASAMGSDETGIADGARASAMGSDEIDIVRWRVGIADGARRSDALVVLDILVSGLIE